MTKKTDDEDGIDAIVKDALRASGISENAQPIVLELNVDLTSGDVSQGGFDGAMKRIEALNETYRQLLLLGVSERASRAKIDKMVSGESN